MAFAPGLLAGRRVLATGGGTGPGRSMGRRFLDLGASRAICGQRGDVPMDNAAAQLPAPEMLHWSAERWAAQRVRTPAR